MVNLMEMYDVVVVGGGPAGMMAAIQVSNRKKVALIDRNETLGKKLLISGGGRCNITNLKSNSEFMTGISDRFLYKGLSSFGPFDIVHFFESRGVPLKEEDNNRMFPASEKAEDILNCMVQELDKVDVLTETVLSIEKEGYDFVTKTNKNTYKSRIVILATGGKSYPKLGSTGDGFEFAKNLGHKIVSTYPMNTPIISNDSFIQSKVLQGLTLPDVNIIYRSKSFRGSMIFTHFGISGPIVLNISKDVHFGLEENNEVFIDLIPDESIENIRNGYLKEGKNFLLKYLPKRLVEHLITTYEVNKNATEISKKSLTSFVEGIKRFKVTVTGLKGYENAFITGGGVDLKDVDPKTMESKVMFNLYIVGEVLNLQGITGGYNHTIALTTGYVAGNSI